MLEKCAGSVKLLLLGANCLTLIGGVILFFITWSIRSDYKDYQNFLTDDFFFLPMFCIVTSAIILVVCALGFVGVWAGHYFINIAFIVTLIVVFVLHVTACVTAYLLRGNAHELVHTKLTDTMSKYNADTAITIKWDDLQSEFQCCGANNVSDWASGVPVSCCKHVYGAIGQYSCNASSAYPSGCTRVFGEWAGARATTIAVTETVLLVLQGLAMAVGIMMAKILRDDRGFI